MHFKEIKLCDITPSSNNPRKNYSGPKFDELVLSIKEKGVIEPIIVRPIDSEKFIFEIVAGERRFKAADQDAGEGGSGTIPAIIRDLSDDEAFDFMTIENLQREDLTPLEEAESFNAYLKMRGDDALQDLAQRTGIRPQYIRKRRQAMELPAYILKEWQKGDLAFGHLEQFMRLNDKKQIKEAFEWAKERTVRDLKNHIDSQSPQLTKAIFDLEKAGCPSCSRNSEVQKKMFDIDGMKGAHCLDPKCFKKMTNNYLNGHWNETEFHKKFKTNGFRFYDFGNWNEHERFYAGARFKKCKTCEKYVTLINNDGKVYAEKACADPSCFSRLQKAAANEKKKDSIKEDGKPRVSWHGEYFREKFFEERIPEQYQDTDKAVVDQLNLFALLKSNQDLRVWFANRMNIKDKDGGKIESYWQIDSNEFLKIIEVLSPKDLAIIKKEATLEIIMQPVFGAAARLLVSKYIGIDLLKEFAITKEYLQKKTIKEILEFGKVSGIFKDPLVREYLVMIFKKKSFTSLKKKELVSVFLESGVDLVGKVPGEILKK